MEYFNLDYVPIEDRHLEHLKKLRRLGYLCLSYGGLLTAAGLVAAAREMTALKVLCADDVLGVRRLSREALAEVQAALPGVQLIRTHGHIQLPLRTDDVKRMLF